MSPTDAKRLVRSVFDQEENEIPLEDARSYSSTMHALESVGAQVEVIRPATQQGAARDV